IPVASLLMGESPLYMDLTSFLLALFPLTCICFLIRHYVQKWVVEETERGFHIVGGLLQIGTWWIHLTGFIYTIIRKKVPYIPTPKDDRDPTPFRLHIPNLFIIAISLFAIIYGLNRDWTPFSLVMAGFAMINIIVLSFVIYASYKKASYLKINMVFTAKKHLWLFRHWLYRFARENALILSCLIITGTISAYHDLNRVEDYSVASLPRDKVFYRGIFQPTSDNGITSVGNVFKNKKDSIQIVSFYVSWSDTSLYNIFPISEMEEVYKNNAIPLLTVDPWLSKKQVFKQITEGRYDSSIKNMARTLAHLNKPVFFRFAQEPENLHFPWSSTGGNTPQSFINAWRYMHDQFESAGASKVIWVYNPGNPQNVGQYFPGSEYVDWLGVNILNYNSQLQGQSSFEDLYRPFHNTAIFQQDLPVLLTEVGTLSGDKKNWWDSAWSMMDTAFSEIRGVVAYNNNFDHHGLNGYQEIPLQWSLPLESAFGYAFPAVPLNNSDFNDTLRVYPERSMTVKPLPENIHAVVYDKGYHWSRNIHTVSEKVLRFDIASMESMKINTIFRTIPGVYDKNVFSMCKMKGIRIIPMLSAELDPESMADKRLMEREKKRLIDIVDDYKDNPSVLAWNISNDVLSKLEGSYITPDLFFYKVRYLKWLQELVDGIKHIDPVHPVTLNISFDNSTNSRIKDYQTYIGNVDQFYVSAEIRDKDQAKEIIPTGNVAWGPVEPVLWDSLYGNKKFVIPNWQDQEASGFASLNGLFDFEGRKKITYYSVLKHWAIHSDEMDLSTEVKILKPAKLTFPGNKLTYYALTKNSSGQWAFAASQPNTIFEWYLVRTDEYGNPAYLKLAGSGVSYTLTVPYHPETYRLYLKVIKDNQVNGTLSTLNTPLN
ncbi:MAG TPA: glycosyl hydrolase, partial [Flavisolibacter sp.]|nr:glycosyl hydrolase [Flavisolibacter sp.]